ncbi:MAG: FHA domain-containing protein [Chloroflexota bacterium]|nr:FHA domain-containing protein [Chloroflexota bacterium]
MIRCPRCNTELPDGVSFCDACGAPVRGPMPPASPVYQPLGEGGQTTMPPPVASAGPSACPVCGTPVIPGEAFCDNCGASLLTPNGGAAYPSGPPPFAPPAGPPPFAPAPGPPPFAPPSPPYGAPTSGPSPFGTPPPVAPAATPPAGGTMPAGRLIVTASRAELPLPVRDDVILGREDGQSNSFPDVDLNPHGGLEQGVSRRHARISRRNGQFYLEDLNSVNGTLHNQRRIPANTPVPLRPGDAIMLGRLGLTFQQ